MFKNIFKMLLTIFTHYVQIPEQFRFMSQHPVKKKHKHKKHKSQESERSKEGGEAVSQGSNLLEQDKPASSSAGTCLLVNLIASVALVFVLLLSCVLLLSFSFLKRIVNILTY